MKKVFAVLALLSLLSVSAGTGAGAETEHVNHPSCGAQGTTCGKGHGCVAVTKYEPLSSAMFDVSEIVELYGNAYYLAEDINLNENTSISFEGKGTIVLCLNGHSITANGYSSAVNVREGDFVLCDCKSGGVIQRAKTGKQSGGVYVNEGSMTMYGGTIQGFNRIGYGGGVNVNKGSMTMYGGTITGNTPTAEGGGVYAFKHVYVYGGTISGNRANYGGGVYAKNGDVVVSGDVEITGNQGYAGGGVYANSGNVEVSGNVEITGNRNGAGKADNVYLKEGRSMQLSGPLTSDASIGVTTKDEPTVGVPVVYMTPAAGMTITESDLAKTFSDNDAYYVGMKDGNAVLYMPTPYTAPTAKALVFSGSAQALVESGECEALTMEYALGADDQNAPASGWSEEIPTGVNVGTYYVWYRAVGNKDYAGIDPACLTVVIAQLPAANLPKTGDASMLGAWIALLGASAAGLRARRKK